MYRTSIDLKNDYTLKRCPFCGNPNIKFVSYYSEDQERLYGCECEDCNCQGPQLEEFDEAIRLWNKRIFA